MKKPGFFSIRNALIGATVLGGVFFGPRACNLVSSSIPPVPAEPASAMPQRTSLAENLNYYTTITLPYGGELIVTQIVGNDGGVYKYAEINGPSLQIDYPASPANPDQSGQRSIGFLLSLGAENSVEEGVTPLFPGTVISVNGEQFYIYVPDLN